MLSATLLAVLQQRPLSLVFDIDGTLSPLVPRPEDARLYPGVAALLAELKRHAHVAIMTGRMLVDGASIVNVEGLTYIGTHGLEWSEGLPATHAVQLIPEARPYVEPANALLNLAERALSDLPGVIVERKQVGGSIHYRNVAAPSEARQRILSLLEEPARRSGMRLSEGKFVVEVLTPLAVNKGSAIRRYAQQTGARGLLFAGDDRTDLDAVLALEQLRQEGIQTCSVVVKHADTLPDLLAHADVIVDEVPGMVQLLTEIAHTLHRKNDCSNTV